MLTKDSKIYVAGHRGLLGTALTDTLQEDGYKNLLIKTHSELDLVCQSEVENFFSDTRPEYVILNAAIPANSINVKTDPMGLMLNNTSILNNIISSSLKHGVKKLIYVSSIAAYPSDSPVSSSPDGPMLLEQSMQPGKIEKETERYYALPKLLGGEICRAVNQTGKMSCSTLVVPHAYGLHYHYETPDRLPVFPALIKRFSDAVINGANEIVIWGTGNLRRELTFSYDIARAFIILLENESAIGTYNSGSGKYVSVRDMAQTLKDISGFKGKLIFDSDRPEAHEFPLLCSDKLRSLGWKPETEFRQGAELAYNHYVKL